MATRRRSTAGTSRALVAFAGAAALAGCLHVTVELDRRPAKPRPEPGAVLQAESTAKHGALDRMRAEERVAMEHVLLREPTSPMVVLRVAFRAGPADDPTGKEGLASVTASCIAQGGSKALSYNQILEALYPMAGSIGGQATHDLTTFVGEVPAEKLEDFYPIFRDLLLEPRFDEADFRRVLENHKNAITKSLRGNNDEELGKATLLAQLYEGHPYGHPEEGTVQGLASITLEDVKAFARERYTQENLLLGIGGGFPGGFGERVLEDLASLPARGETPVALPTPTRPKGQQILIVQKDAPATAVSMGFPLKIQRDDDDYYPLLVANSAFGEHRTFNGRLMQRMRGLRGLNYGDYSYIEHYPRGSVVTQPVPNYPRRQQYFSIWIRPVPHDKAGFAIREAQRELDLLVEKGLEPEEFAATKQFVLNYSKLWVQTVSNRLAYAMDGRIYGTKSLVQEIQDRVSKVTLSQVNAAIRKHLGGASIFIAIVTQDAEGLRDTIRSGEPTPLVYDTEGTPREILDEDEIIEKYPFRVREPIVIRPVEEMFEG